MLRLKLWLFDYLCSASFSFSLGGAQRVQVGVEQAAAVYSVPQQAQPASLQEQEGQMVWRQGQTSQCSLLWSLLHL